MTKHKDTQIFTPTPVADMLLNLVDDAKFADPDTYFLEPTCGKGDILLPMLDRIYNALIEKYEDPEKALATTLYKFIAVEIDPELVINARWRVLEWTYSKIQSVERFSLECFVQYILAENIAARIQCKDFFEFMGTKRPY